MPLHPDALVIRGGTIRDPETLKRKVDMAIEDGDGPVVSVFCDALRNDEHPGMSLTDLCVESDVVHSKVQVTTVSKLVHAGFRLEADVTDGQPSTHHHVVFEEPVQESTLATFIGCFDGPIATPSGGKRRRPE